MEVAIVPAIKPSLMCPGGGSDHLMPPFPPNGMPEVSYLYNSIASGEPLYLQQRANERRSVSMLFALGKSANFFAEVGYDFPLGDLVLSLENVDSSDRYYGVNTPNGNYVRVLGLPAGNYRFVLSEPVISLGNYMGCLNFTFVTLVEPDHSSTMRRDFPPLPTTLDRIPYLRYDREVYTQAYYTLFVDNRPEWISFTLQSNSLLRVSAQHSVNQLDQLQIVLLDRNNRTIAAFMENLLESLSAERYALQFHRPMNSDPSAPAIDVDLEIAISPVNALQNALRNMVPPLPAHCQDSPIPSVQINPSSGTYLYRNDTLLISTDTLSHGTLVSNLSTIRIGRPSVFYARVGFHFLLTDLQLSLSGLLNETGRHVELFGLNGRNLYELSQPVMPGDYSLALTQTVPFGSLISTFPFCARYSLHLSIEPETNNSARVDCSGYDVVPWDLNSPSGGSVPYGGPIRRGYLHLAGDHFLMPRSSSQVDLVLLNVSDRSLLVLITKEDFYADVRYVVQRSGTVKLIAPLISSLSTPSQRSEVFLLTPSALAVPTQYEVELYFKPPSFTSVPCPYFTLQTMLGTLANLERSLVCSPSAVKRLPNSSIPSINSSENAYREHLEAFMDVELFHRYVNRNGAFYYEMPFTLNVPSTLVSVSLGYNAFATALQVDLYRQIGPSFKFVIATAGFTLQRTGTGQTNANVAFSAILYSGSYVLVLSQPPQSQSPFLVNSSTSCFPYLWDLQLIPEDGLPYVVSVSPPGAVDFAPNEDLELEVHFSTLLYSKATHQQITPENGLGTLGGALALQVVNDVTITVSPSRVESEGMDSPNWRFIFSKPFLAKRTYQLVLHNGILVDRNGSDIHLFSTNRYSMFDVNCAGHGTLDAGYCFCSEGYAGPDCSLCDAGYRMVDGICRKTSGDPCVDNPAACSCDPRKPKTCVPLGKCNASTGHIVCTCFFPFDGPTCSDCVAGHSNFQEGCPQNSSCPVCVRGSCDPSLRICICPDHWEGRTCAECALGWTGDNCSSPSNYPSPSSSNSSGFLKFLEALEVIGYIGVSLVILVTIVFLLRRRFGKLSHRYSPLDMDMDDMDINDASFSTSGGIDGAFDVPEQEIDPVEEDLTSHPPAKRSTPLINLE